MLAARILRAANKIADKVALSQAVTMHAVPDGMPPTPQQQPQQSQRQQWQQARGGGGAVAAAAGVPSLG